MGMPASSFDSLVEETRIAARRRRRRRRQRRQRIMLWLLTVVTTAVLAVIGLFVVRMSTISTAAGPAALSASARTVSNGTAARRVSPHHTPAPASLRVTDTASGLSYRLLGSPWQQGCPSDLNTPMFDWSTGENAVAGHIVLGGSMIDWHGLACSGLLQPQFIYAGPADLGPTAMSLLGALDPAYYAGVPHSRTITDNFTIWVSGHQGWMVEFQMDYADGAIQGLTWTTELGAVAVVDRGADQAPAVFYVSVPANLGTQNVTTLINSLRIS